MGGELVQTELQVLETPVQHFAPFHILSTEQIDLKGNST